MRNNTSGDRLDQLSAKLTVYFIPVAFGDSRREKITACKKRQYKGYSINQRYLGDPLGSWLVLRSSL